MSRRTGSCCSPNRGRRERDARSGRNIADRIVDNLLRLDLRSAGTHSERATMAEEVRPGAGEQAKRYALAQLRQAIARGEMAPAQRLVENELAEQFGVTRASI